MLAPTSKGKAGEPSLFSVVVHFPGRQALWTRRSMSQTVVLLKFRWSLPKPRPVRVLIACVLETSCLSIHSIFRKGCNVLLQVDSAEASSSKEATNIHGHARALTLMIRHRFARVSSASVGCPACISCCRWAQKRRQALRRRHTFTHAPKP